MEAINFQRKLECQNFRVECDIFPSSRRKTTYSTEHRLDLEIAHMKFMQNQQPNENQLRNNTGKPHIWFIQCSNRPKQLYWMCAQPQNSAEMQAVLKIKLINSNVMPKKPEKPRLFHLESPYL